MFSIIFAVAIFLSVIDPSRGCASLDKVTTLDTVVREVNITLQAILQNTTITMEAKYAAILGLVCDNPMILQAAKAIEQQVVSCPDLVTASTVGTLQLGPLTFSDLLEKFQSFDHFCECKPLLLQVLSVEMIQSEIMYNDPSVFYKNIINMTAICMLTSSSHSVNFTEVATLVQVHKARCPPVFHYSSFNMIRMAEYILRDCEYYSREKFACALNYTKSEDLDSCLKLVDQNMTLNAGNESVDASFYRCRRADCVEMNMAECEYKAIYQYMLSVEIAHTNKQFQWSGCVPRTSASCTIHPAWILVIALLTLHVLDTII